MNLPDFPFIETGMAQQARLLAVFTHNPFVIANLYVLSTYILVLWAALFALLGLGVSGQVALSASLLYAFAPYHVWRGAIHPHLASHYSVPLAVLVALWLCRGEPVLAGYGPRGGPRRADVLGRRSTALVSCGAIALSGPYHGLFGTYLIAVAGLIGWLRRPSWSRAVEVLLLVGLIVALFATQLVPFVMYWRSHGYNPAATFRQAYTVMHLGLRMSYLLHPVAGHRLSWFADPSLERLKARFGNVLQVYNTTYNEASLTARLGVLASVGFLVLLVVALAWPIRRCRGVTRLGDLARLNIAALLLAQSGGMGEQIALNLTAMIRAYNRMSIVIAFLALAALALLVDEWRSRRAFSGWGFTLALSIVVILGLLDQISPMALPDHRADATCFLSDREFVGRIEAAVPAEAMIFQLPPNSFPEFGIHFEMPDYDLFRGYLHSTRLRWSYGALRGREAERWQSSLAPLAVPELVAGLREKGFVGIYLNRRGHDQRGAALEKELSLVLGGPHLVSRDSQLSFFRIGQMQR
jgi:phosphoglycerol transferase